MTDKDLNENAKEIIDARDKYGIVNFKLEAEAWYVKSTTISVENLREHLLFADDKNCAQIKEDLLLRTGPKCMRSCALKISPVT